MGNPFVYVQLQSQNLQEAKKFYSELLDWKLEESPDAMSSYTEIVVGEGTAGGMMMCPSPQMLSQWLPYVGVDDVEEVTRRAEALGAKVILGPAEVPGKGKYSIVLDPAGTNIALWQAS